MAISMCMKKIGYFRTWLFSYMPTSWNSFVWTLCLCVMSVSPSFFSSDAQVSWWAPPYAHPSGDPLVSRLAGPGRGWQVGVAGGVSWPLAGGRLSAVGLESLATLVEGYPLPSTVCNMSLKHPAKRALLASKCGQTGGRQRGGRREDG